MAISLSLAIVIGIAYILYKALAPKRTRQPNSKFDPFMVELAAVLFIAVAFAVRGGFEPTVLFIALVCIGLAMRRAIFHEVKQVYRRR